MTDRLFDDGPDPFDLVRGVPRDMLGEEPEEDRGAYLRLAVDVLDDEAVAVAIDQHGADAFALFVAVLLTAKAAHAFGVTAVNMRTLAASVGLERMAAAPVLDTLERVGLVWLDRSGGQVRRLRVRQWRRWQTMTNAESQRLRRARTDALSDDTVMENVTATPETKTRPQLVTDTETGDRKEPSSPHLASATAPVRARVREADPQPASDFQPVAAAAHPDADKWWHVAAASLAFIHQGDATVQAELAQQIADHRFSPSRRHDERWTTEAYQRAAVALQRQADGGWRPQDGTAAGAMAYYFRTIASHRVELPALAPPTTNPETHTDERPTAARPRHAGLAAFD